MKVRPIPFSAPMVQALLEGRKTQARRTIKPSNSLFNGGAWLPWARKAETSRHFGWRDATVDVGPSPAGNLGPYLHLPYDGPDSDWQGTRHRIYPDVQPGDLLWVRETYRHIELPPHQWDEVGECEIDYRATPRKIFKGCEVPWRPSIHMPRRDSRLTLRITDVSVERLQDIRGMDALREGVSIPAHIPHDGADLDYACREYRHLWESINGPGSWDANPWVWVISFEVIQKNVVDLIVGVRG